MKLLLQPWHQQKGRRSIRFTTHVPNRPRDVRTRRPARRLAKDPRRSPQLGDRPNRGSEDFPRSGQTLGVALTGASHAYRTAGAGSRKRSSAEIHDEENVFNAHGLLLEGGLRPSKRVSERGTGDVERQQAMGRHQRRYKASVELNVLNIKFNNI